MGPPLAGPSRVMEICESLGEEQTDPTVIKLPENAEKLPVDHTK